MKHKIDVMISTRDRHTETCLLLQSLRTQSFQNFDIIIIDESQTPILMNYPFITMIARLKLENHCVKVIRNNVSGGVCFARNMMIDEQMKNHTDADLCLRVDDDVILQPDFLQRLVSVIDKGFDLASGVVPLLGFPEHIREAEYIFPVINYHELNDKGELSIRHDDCGFCYDKSDILPTAQFRTNCLYKYKLHTDGIRYPKNLTNVGFREELHFSFQALIKGYKIGVDTGAVAYHTQTPSGGVRCTDYNQNVALDEETTNKWIKKQFEKKGDFLK